jgi:1-pyrroline-5-carboxylate dehydrogenase
MYRFYFRRYASTFSLRYTTKNEPILEYRRDSKEVKQVQTALDEYKSKITRIPCIVDGKEIWSNNIQKQTLPFDHKHVLAEYCYADGSLIQKAIDSAVKNQFKWDLMPIEQRANIFLKVTFLFFIKEIFIVLIISGSRSCSRYEMAFSFSSINYVRSR